MLGLLLGMIAGSYGSSGSSGLSGSPSTVVATTETGFDGFAFPFMSGNKVVFVGKKAGSSGLYMYSTITQELKEVASSTEGFTYISSPFVSKAGVLFIGTDDKVGYSLSLKMHDS